MTGETAQDQSALRFWQRWSGRYDWFMRRDAALYDAVAARMKPRLHRDMNVLELGCGTGLLSQRIAGCVRDLEATDLAPEMIAQARKKPASCRVHYSVQDAVALPYASETFDAVVAANVLHIMPQPEKALAEARRVLKPGGVLIVPTFVHGEGGRGRLRRSVMRLFGFRVDHRWGAAQFSDFVARCGFAPLRQETLGSALAPLCYLEARKGEGSRDPNA